MRAWMLRILRAGYPLAIYWWATWSRVHQWLQVRAWRRSGYVPPRVPRGDLTPSQINVALSRVTYQADGWRELWDAVGHPAKVERLVRWTTSHRPDDPPGRSWIESARDCDDFAQWAALRMETWRDPRLLAVAWLDPNGRPQGHVVCLFVWHMGGVGHVGNWGLHGPLDGPGRSPGVVESIYTPATGNVLIGYAELTPDLRVRRIVRGGAA